jgi:hypothetical protein
MHKSEIDRARIFITSELFDFDIGQQGVNVSALYDIAEIANGAYLARVFIGDSDELSHVTITRSPNGDFTSDFARESDHVLASLASGSYNWEAEYERRQIQGQF